MKIGTARVRTYIHRNICPLLAFISKYIHRYMKTNSEDSLCVKALIKTKQKKKRKEKNEDVQQIAQSKKKRKKNIGTYQNEVKRRVMSKTEDAQITRIKWRLIGSLRSPRFPSDSPPRPLRFNDFVIIIINDDYARFRVPEQVGERERERERD